MPRRFLRLTRAHTVPLEAVPAVIGAALATGTVLSVDVLLWGVFGMLYHLSGYGMNSYTDWKNGYDKTDEWKQHHPLNSGELSPQTAKVVVFALFALTVAYGILLSYSSPFALFALGVAVVSGVVYNELGKETPWKFLFIAYAHTSVFIVPFLTLSDTVTAPFLIGAMYVFVWVVYQISVSGEVKDMSSEEANFMKYLGAKKIDAAVWFSDECKLYAFSLKAINVLLAIGVVLTRGFNLAEVLIILLLGSLALWFNGQLLKSELYCRALRIEKMSAIEMFTLVIFCVSYIGYIDVGEIWAVIAVAGAWVILGNKYVWGTWMAPRV